MTPQALAQDAGTLFSLPEAAIRANALINSPDYSVPRLAQVIEFDPGLTVRVLRLANSPLFGHVAHIDSVSHAILLIGERALRDLVLATAVTNVFKGIPAEFVDMSTFWDNSATCGVICRLLARRRGIRDSERMFVAGLLHAIGRLVFYSRQPDRYRAVLKARVDGEQAVLAEEVRVFGFNYAELGAALLAAWKLPEFFQVVIAHQFDPDKADAFRKEAAILHVARDMAAELSPSLKSRQPPEIGVSESDVAAAAMLGLALEDLVEIRIDALAQTIEVIDIINPDAGTIF